MLECLIVGDSIAVGVSQVRTECVSHSVGGINSWQWNKKFKDANLTSNSVIISLGTNDHSGVHTFRELLSMRERVEAKHVYWIMPPCNDKFCKPNVNEWVKIIAEAHGDTIVGTQRLQKDHIHPSAVGYRELAIH